jgi:adenine phosphoribosyltransferase
MPGYLTAEMDPVIRRLINPAFPTPTRSFTDITLMLEQHAEAFRALVLEMCRPHRAVPPDALVCIESCGYLFGAPMAFELGCPLVLARRAGKLPRATLRREYRSSGLATDPARTMEIHEGAIAPGSRVRIVDEVLATGGTAMAAVDLVEQAEGIPVGVSVAFELERFHARQRLEERGVPVHAAMRL